ncbi:MAG: amidohydrolase family protein [Defluviicoccus sp.]|nr:amidohydrolase family protein [Defluviicoccus sp.]MDE0385101.1 amidohydrolase family protein [Defluviicoccus sp.]
MGNRTGTEADTAIRRCRALVPRDGALALGDCDIEIRDGLIARIAAPGEGRAAEIVEGGDRLVAPGLVNAHTHSPLNVLRGTADGMDHVGFMWANQAVTAGRGAEEIAVSAALGALDMLRSGVTAAIDHYPEQNCAAEDVGPLARAYAGIGMRAAIALRVFDRAYDDIDPARIDGVDLSIERDLGDNPLAPLPIDEIADLCEQAADAWHGHGGLVSIMPGPSNPIRCSDEMLVRCHEIAAARGLGIHTHLLETRIQRTLAQERYGRTMVAQLDALGILDRRWSLAHTVWVDGDDIGLLAARKAVVVHNPHSNSKIGAGVAPIARMLANGVPVALGTDGASTNDTLSIHEAMSLAALLPRIAGVPRADWPDAADAFDMATKGGAAAFVSGPRLGAVEAGAAADLVLYDLDTLSLAPLNDPLQQLVFAERGRAVRTVLVAGKVVYEDGTFASADAEAAIRAAKGMRESHAERNRALYRFAEALEAAQERAARV